MTKIYRYYTRIQYYVYIQIQWRTKTWMFFQVVLIGSKDFIFINFYNYFNYIITNFCIKVHVIRNTIETRLRRNKFTLKCIYFMRTAGLEQLLLLREYTGLTGVRQCVQRRSEMDNDFLSIHMHTRCASILRL